MSTMSVQDKIASGYYVNKVPYTKSTREEWRQENYRIEAEFKEDLAREFGVDTHPKAPLLWDRAWSLGHASGFSEVYNYYLDLVELIKP